MRDAWAAPWRPAKQIAQSKLDRLKGQFTQFEVTGFALTNLFDAFGVAAFQFGGVLATWMLLRFSPTGFAFLLQLVVRAYLLEAQRATAEEFVLAQFGKTPPVQFGPQSARCFDMGKDKEKVAVIAFQLLDGFQQ